MTFGLYLNRLFLLRLIVATLALAGLLQLVELMDKADEILARGLGTVGIVRFGLYRLPLLLGPVQPIAVLIAALLTWGRWPGAARLPPCARPACRWRGWWRG